jgi:hypothetical protein
MKKWGSPAHDEAMCRNIRILHNFEPPTTQEEIHAAALQCVRKVRLQKPTHAEHDAFDRAVHEVAAITEHLIESLLPRVPRRTREGEQQKARDRWKEREARLHRA